MDFSRILAQDPNSVNPSWVLLHLLDGGTSGERVTDSVKTVRTSPARSQVG